MRKHLMAGTALAAATMLVAGGALAADKKMMKPSLTVGGFFAHEVGGMLDRNEETKTTAMALATGGDLTQATLPGASAAGVPASATMDDEVETSAVDSRNDAEIHFKGQATLDSGIKIGVRVELEGNTASDQIDESYMTISGSFGQITLGSDDNAPDKMLLGYSGQWATRVGSAPFLRGKTWIGDASGLSTYSGLNWGGDASKITYISPKLGGFSVGVSYTPDGNEDSNANPDADTTYHDGISGGMAYSGTFGDVSFGGGAGYTAAQAGNDSMADDLKMWGVAARLGFGPMTVAAGYKVQTDPEPDKHSVVDLGVRYVAGANSFSLSGTHSEADEGDASITIAVASYARQLGPGVKWFSDIMWTQSESDTVTTMYNADGTAITDPTSPTGNDYSLSVQSENSGMALVTGISVAF